MSRRHDRPWTSGGGRLDSSADAGHRRSRRLVRRRLVRGAAAAAFPTGPPQTGEGVLWQVSLTALTALSLAVWQRHRIRRAIVAPAAVSGLILLVLNVSEPIGSPWRPVYWPEFAAILGLFIIAMVASDTSLRWPSAVTKRLSGRIGRLPFAARLVAGPAPLRIAAALLLGGAIVATSANKTAMGIAALTIPAMLALSWLIGAGRLWRVVAIVSAIAITFAVPAGMYWLGINKGRIAPFPLGDDRGRVRSATFRPPAAAAWRGLGLL